MRSRAIAALVAVMAVLAGCSDDGPAPPLTYDRPPREELTPAFAGAPTLPPPDMTNDGPGSLVSAEPFTDANIESANATAVKVVYRSTSGVDGAAAEVSGVVAVPPGTPPKGGWPILSFAHSLIGVMPKCAPSMADGLWGYSQLMATLLGRGFVVALSDYQGLGTPGGGRHSIVDAATLGNNVIDAARTARRVLPSASTRWAAFGIGEGGLAAWAAAERAGIYGGGMDLVGSVAIAPYADLSPMVDAAASGQFAGSQQIQMYIQVLQSLENADPSFDLDAQRSASARQRWDLLTDCAPKDPQQAQQALAQLKPEDVQPQSPAAAADARQRLADAALPARYPTPGSAPVFVVFGTADTSTPALGIQQALASACAKGDRIEVNKRAGDTEVTNDQIIQSSIAWMVARFDGQRLGNVCVGAT